MSSISVPPSGQYSNTQKNSRYFVNSLPTSKQEEPSGPAKLSTTNPEVRDRLQKEVEQSVREGNVTEIILPGKLQGGYINGVANGYDGKTVINNRPGSITVKSLIGEDGLLIITPSEANKSAANGAATHGFFYHKFDFLLEAAEKYSKLGENEIFAYRDIEDREFILNTLDFFTNGNYTNSDVDAMQKQMTDVVTELAQQIKNGEAPDFGKLQNTLTIGGGEVSISQLMDFQKVGNELKEPLSIITVGSVKTEVYAKMGLAKAIGNYYGNDKGEIGKLFSSAIDRLYEKSQVLVEELYNSPNQFSTPFKWTERQKDAVETSMKIADIFSKLDTSSKEDLSRDFASKLSETQSMVKNHSNKYGFSSSYVGLAGDIADITKYYQSWMDKIG